MSTALSSCTLTGILKNNEVQQVANDKITNLLDLQLDTLSGYEIQYHAESSTMCLTVLKPQDTAQKHEAIPKRTVFH